MLPKHAGKIHVHHAVVMNETQNNRKSYQRIGKLHRHSLTGFIVHRRSRTRLTTKI